MFKFLVIVIFLSHVDCAIESFTSSTSEVVNGNIQYLFALPVERVHLFETSDNETVGGKPLLPNWMRNDLNKLALRLREIFTSTVPMPDRDERDASWVQRRFKDWQLSEMRINDTANLLSLINERELVESYEGLRKLLPKIGIDFTNKMGAITGSRHVFQAKLWAEVFLPGDAMSPTFMGKDGAQVVGVVHTNLPKGIKGNPTFEIIDPRGQNPPFGKDQRYIAQTGVGLLMPGWATRMTPPHRCCDPPVRPDDPLTDLVRIDWVFEIGLFQYPKDVLTRYVDYENCPFSNTHEELMTQSFFDLELETLVNMQPPPEVLKRIEMATMPKLTR